MENLVYQQQENGCGFACVKMMLIHYFKNSQFSNLIEPKIGDKKPNLNEIIQYANEYNLSLKAYKLANRDEILKCNVFPIILLIEKSNKSHLIYLQKIKGETLYIFDPEKGKYKINYAAFARDFSGIYLQSDNPVNNSKSVIKAPFIENKRWKLLTIVLEFFSFISLFVGICSVSENGTFLLSLISFILFVILKLVEKIVLIQSIKKFDINYYSQLDSLTNNKEKIYSFYNKYKVNSFGTNLSLISCSIEVVLLSVLICMSNFAFSIGILSAILLSIISVTLDKKKTTLEDRINANEKNYLSAKATKNISIIEIFNDSYILGYRKSIKETVNFFVDLVICLIICLLSQTIELNYMLFLLLYLYYIQDRFEYLFTKALKSNEFNKDKAYFIGYFINK